MRFQSSTMLFIRDRGMLFLFDLIMLVFRKCTLRGNTWRFCAVSLNFEKNTYFRGVYGYAVLLSFLCGNVVSLFLGNYYRYVRVVSSKGIVWIMGIGGRGVI